MPWPVKSTEMVNRDRSAVNGSTVRSTIARMGPSVPRTPQVFGGSMWSITDVLVRLAPPIRRVVLYPPDHRRPVTLDSARDEYRVGDMGPLYVAAARRAADAGVRIVLRTRYDGRRDGVSLLTGPDDWRELSVRPPAR